MKILKKKKKEQYLCNLQNSKTNKVHTLSINLSGKIDLKEPRRNLSLSNLSIFYKENSEYKNNKAAISASRWNDEFELFGSFHINSYFNTTHQ